MDNPEKCKTRLMAYLNGGTIFENKKFCAGYNENDSMALNEIGRLNDCLEAFPSLRYAKNLKEKSKNSSSTTESTGRKKQQ
jgi:hypothetical protein